jgi:acylphosphatase
VRNLPDGRVELFIQGEQGAVMDMEDWCRVGAPCSRVTGISVSENTPIEGETGFEIR